jgi:hypothetical protein
MAIAYAISGGIKAGSLTAQQQTKTELDKKPPTIDKTDTGKKAIAGALNTIAKIYTFTSGAKEGWRKSWPETKTVISDRRTQVKDAKAARKEGAKGAADPDDYIDAEIVDDAEEPALNTKGPTAPDPAKAAGADASADASIRITVITDPPADPPRPTSPPPAEGGREGWKPAPAPGPAAPPPYEPADWEEDWDWGVEPKADPAPASSGPAPAPDPDRRWDPDAYGGAGGWWVWDPRRDRFWLRPDPVTDSAPPDSPHLRVVTDDPTTSTSAPGSSMPTNLPTATSVVTEVDGVDSLMTYLAQLSGWARVEMDDAQAAVTRLTDLQAKAEHAFNAAAAAKYDKGTLQQLAAIVERLAKLRDSREKDLVSSDLCAQNAATASSNVWARHGGIAEAVAAAPVEMAESDTYGD